MNYISVAQFAKKWDISERTVRNYCTNGKINGSFITGKTWNIPEDAQKPDKNAKKDSARSTLLKTLKAEKQSKLSGGIYHKMQIELTYNSNHIEGSQLTHEQTRYIYETNTIGTDNKAINVDDIVETVNHFKCIDYVIENASKKLSENFIKELHYILKSGTSDSRLTWFNVGEYKKLSNEVGGKATTLPENVSTKMKEILTDYNQISSISINEIIDFHHKFEITHPFQDGNGRIGRLIMLKECLNNNVVPFIISDELKLFYYRGLSEWKKDENYLLDTCLTAQDKFKLYLDYFKISY